MYRFTIIAITAIFLMAQTANAAMACCWSNPTKQDSAPAKSSIQSEMPCHDAAKNDASKKDISSDTMKDCKNCGKHCSSTALSVQTEKQEFLFSQVLPEIANYTLLSSLAPPRYIPPKHLS